MVTAPVIKIIDSSVVDGPGNRAAVFLQGCNFTCKYCHNPETIDPAGRPDTLEFLTVEQVVERVGSSLPFIRGLTISGGECMLHEEFVYRVCREAKRRYGQDFTCLLDSNGSLPYDKVLSVVDGVLLDVKAVDETVHRTLTGAPAAPVLTAAAALAKAGKLAEIRTVVLGGSREPEACIRKLADLIREAAGKDATGRISYKLIRYRPKGVRKEYLKELKVPDGETMENLSLMARSEGFFPVTIV
jgi:pyruvate formate lyase activating enzyme